MIEDPFESAFLAIPIFQPYKLVVSPQKDSNSIVLLSKMILVS